MLMAVAALSVNAQNVQVHYDFGRHLYPDQEDGRQSATITLEQFKADKWGSWYYFVDLDLSNKFMEGAYTEISREFNIGNKGFAAHVEYDGGLNRFGSFQQAALLGAAYNGHTADFSKTWSAQLMYKRFFKSYENTRAYNSVQLTGVWGIIRMWQQVGLPVKTAGDSQALIQLKKEYCDKKDCLRCRFGYEYLKQK